MRKLIMKENTKMMRRSRLNEKYTYSVGDGNSKYDFMDYFSHNFEDDYSGTFFCDMTDIDAQVITYVDGVNKDIGILLLTTYEAPELPEYYSWIRGLTDEESDFDIYDENGKWIDNIESGESKMVNVAKAWMEEIINSNPTSANDVYHVILNIAKREGLRRAIDSKEIKIPVYSK